MDIVTKYNLDEIFYGMSADQDIKLYAINNILTSAAGHKIMYELKNIKRGSTVTLSEAELEHALDNKSLVRNIEEVQDIVNKRAHDIIEDLEKLKRDFLKAKLNRTLHHNERKAQTSVDTLKKKMGLDEESEDEESEDEESEESGYYSDDQLIKDYVEQEKKSILWSSKNMKV